MGVVVFVYDVMLGVKYLSLYCFVHLSTIVSSEQQDRTIVQALFGLTVSQVYVDSTQHNE